MCSDIVQVVGFGILDAILHSLCFYCWQWLLLPMYLMCVFEFVVVEGSKNVAKSWQ